MPDLHNLAKRLAKACPERFVLRTGSGYWELATLSGGWLLWSDANGEQAEHDGLFGEVWREAEKRGWKPAVDSEDGHVLAVLYGTHEHGTKNNASSRGETPGVALATAFVAAGRS